jgi:hypothetical protein
LLRLIEDLSDDVAAQADRVRQMNAQSADGAERSQALDRLGGAKTRLAQLAERQAHVHERLRRMLNRMADPGEVMPPPSNDDGGAR